MKRHTSYTLILAACCAACLIPAEARQFPWTEPQTASEILTDCTNRKRSAGTEAQQLPDSARIYTPIYTLRECMEYAVSNSTQIRIQQAAMDDERIARRDAILNAFTPSIQAGTAVSSNFGRAVDPETNTYISTTSFDNSYSVSAGITLFNGFQAVNNLRITKTAVAMGVSEEQRIRDNICLSTMQAYCNVVYYSRLAEILKEQVETAAESLHVAERQEELGQKGYADVVQMKAELAEMEYKLISAENGRKDAMLTLKDVMFWPMTEELAIDLSIADSMAFLPDSGGDGNTVLENAKATLPDIFIARGAMENARMELSGAKKHLINAGRFFFGKEAKENELAKQDKGVLARLRNLFAKMSNGFSALEHKSLNLADKLRYNRIKDSVKADLDFLNGKTAENDTPTLIKDNVR